MRAARYRIVLLIALLLAAAFFPADAARAEPDPPPATAIAGAADHVSDVVVYERIANRVRAGQPYHRAAAAEHRAAGYPLKPFVTIRPPLLAWGWAFLPMVVLGFVLLGAAMAAWAFAPGLAPLERIVLPLAVAFGGWHLFLTPSRQLHELWAGLLLCLAAAFVGRGRGLAAVIIAGVAVLARELALPFLALGLALSYCDNRRREALAWAAAIVLFGIWLGWHALAVGAVVRADDLASPGWFGWNGPWHVLEWVRMRSLLRIAPDDIGIVVAALAPIGWLALPTRQGRFVALYLLGMTIALSIAPRPDNFFWILVVLPLWFGGIAFLPRLFRRLAAIGLASRPLSRDASEQTRSANADRHRLPC